MAFSGNQITALVTAAIIAVTAVNSVTAVTKVETAACGKTVTLADCVQKTLICSPLDNLLAPMLGTPAAISACATKTGVPLKSQFFTGVGQSLVSGGSSSSSGIADELTSSKIANAAIRQCVLNATGALTPDMASLDRNAIAEQVALLSPPALGAAVVGGVETCPEPINFKITTFIRCLKKICIASAVLPTPAPPSFGGAFF